MYRLIDGVKQEINFNSKYNKNEIIYFICEKCGIESSIKYRSWRKINICSSCRRKESICKIIQQNKNNILKKRKQTNLEKYGNENYVNADKAKQTIIEKYGVENISQLNEIKEKKKITMMKNYGTWKSFELTSSKNTILKKYGVDNVSYVQEIKEKISIANKKKSGSSLIKRQKTNLEKYGVENIMDLNKFLTYDKLLIDKRFEMLVPLFERKNYIDSKTIYSWKCKVCGQEFEDNLLSGKVPRCPICLPFYKSIGEQEIADYVKSLGMNIIENNRELIKPHELDIYIPQYKIAIEFNGIYFHTERNGKDRDYHLNKTIECEKLGIALLHIFEDEWINKQDIVKNIIKIKLGMIENKIGARKCNIRELESKNTKKFLDENHIQGYIPAKINIGLYYQDELVSLLTFGKPRFNKKYDWEILRYVNKQEVSIIGGFSKMLKYFRKNNLGSILTYSDKRLFDGQIYENNGFIKQNPSPPNYYYFKNGKRYSRQQFQKHKLDSILESFDSNLTEWENMQLNGFDRIWDCGNNVYIMRNKNEME